MERKVVEPIQEVNSSGKEANRVGVRRRDAWTGAEASGGLLIFTAGARYCYSKGAPIMVIALWVAPAEDDRVFATVGCWLGTSQAHSP